VPGDPVRIMYAKFQSTPEQGTTFTIVVPNLGVKSGASQV